MPASRLLVNIVAVPGQPAFTGQVNRRSGPRLGCRVYDQAVREVLILVWEASDRICSKRLRPLLPILVLRFQYAAPMGQAARSIL
jgi:hypothetical protein